MYIKKMTYEDSYKKRLARKDAFSRYNMPNVVGLAGPDLYGCVEEYKKAGFNNISVYENDKAILMLQLPQLARVDVNYHFDDIYNAPIGKGTVYDLDFCCRIEKVERYVRKFSHNFVLTVSERGVRKFSSMGLLLKMRDEKFVSRYPITPNIQVLESNKGKYLFTSYHDKSPMLIINKI